MPKISKPNRAYPPTSAFCSVHYRQLKRGREQKGRHARSTLAEATTTRRAMWSGWKSAMAGGEVARCFTLAQGGRSFVSLFFLASAGTLLLLLLYRGERGDSSSRVPLCQHLLVVSLSSPPVTKAQPKRQRHRGARAILQWNSGPPRANSRSSFCFWLVPFTPTRACRRGSSPPGRCQWSGRPCRRPRRRATAAAAPRGRPTPTCRRSRPSPPPWAGAAPAAPGSCSTPARCRASWTSSWTNPPACSPRVKLPLFQSNPIQSNPNPEFRLQARRRRPYLRDVDGDDVGLAALVEEPDGEVARSAALVLHPHRQVPVLVLARHPAHAWRWQNSAIIVLSGLGWVFDVFPFACNSFIQARVYGGNQPPNCSSSCPVLFYASYSY